jgi:hypothetical protein
VLQCSVSVSCAHHGEFVWCACSSTSPPPPSPQTPFSSAMKTHACASVPRLHGRARLLSDSPPPTCAPSGCARADERRLDALISTPRPTRSSRRPGRRGSPPFTKVMHHAPDLALTRALPPFPSCTYLLQSCSPPPVPPPLASNALPRSVPESVVVGERRSAR